MVTKTRTKATKPTVWGVKTLSIACDHCGTTCTARYAVSAPYAGVSRLKGVCANCTLS